MEIPAGHMAIVIDADGNVALYMPTNDTCVNSVWVAAISAAHKLMTDDEWCEGMAAAFAAEAPMAVNRVN